MIWSGVVMAVGRAAARGLADLAGGDGRARRCSAPATACTSSVDAALITQVLPQAADRAKDLGVINIANSAPQVLGAGAVRADRGVARRLPGAVRGDRGGHRARQPAGPEDPVGALRVGAPIAPRWPAGPGAIRPDNVTYVCNCLEWQGWTWTPCCSRRTSSPV